MDRRDFLTAGKTKKKTSVPFASPARTLSGINPYAGAWTTNEVTHLLKRAMFGAKKTDVDYFVTRTMSQAVDELLNPAAPEPAPPLKEYTTSTDVQTGQTPDTNIAQGTTWANDWNYHSDTQGRRQNSYYKWWTGVLINQDRSIREKLMFFWINHFGNQGNEVFMVIGYINSIQHYGKIVWAILKQW
ncbi:MAG: DUF1800 family protein [Chitinophagaceae bacterium]|nr:DUF1800 family protein [Chitinophagaceae bacterium]